MIDYFQYLISGIFFGLIAGISPGPLLTLVIAETLKYNKIQGFKVAIAPLITDIPIIFIAIFLLSKLSDFNHILGIISFLGAAFIFFWGFECIKTKGIELNMQNIKSKALKKGVLANILNPHPYFFWLTVGAPTLFKSYQKNIISTILFITSFYIVLVGSKIVISIMVEKSRMFFNNETYKWIMKILGFSLIFFAILFIKEGIEYLHIL